MLGATDRDFLLSRSIERTLGRGYVPYQQGDESHNLFVITSGLVKVHYNHDSGTSITASYYRDGMLVGAHGHSHWSSHHVWSAQALVDCRTIWIRRADLRDLVDRSPAAMACLLAITEFKADQLRKVIRILATPRLEDRIYMALQHLGSTYGIDRGDRIEIDGRFTHQELSEMVGASRQSVTMALLSLEKSGQIWRKERRYFILPEGVRASTDPPLGVAAE